jgi:hypothetical protein
MKVCWRNTWQLVTEYDLESANINGKLYFINHIGRNLRINVHLARGFKPIGDLLAETSKILSRLPLLLAGLGKILAYL